MIPKTHPVCRCDGSIARGVPYHAAWATYVVFRGNEKTRRGFHTLSIVVWLVWLVPYFVGMLIGIPAFHVSDPIALAAAAGVVAVLALALLLTSKRSHA